MPKRTRSYVSKTLKDAKRIRRKSNRAKPMQLFTRPTPNGATNLYSLAPGPTRLFKPTVKTVFRYVGIATFTSSIAAPSTYVLRANSCNDPDQTGTGHQPRYYDQLVNSNMYNSCLVTKCDYVLEFDVAAASVSGTSVKEPVVIVVHAAPATGSFANIHVMTSESENPFSQLCLIDEYKQQKISGSIDIAKVLGITPQELKTNTAYRHGPSANPTNACLLNIHHQVAGSVNKIMYITYSMRYHVTLFNRQVVPES